jgi:hypothetical protein
VPAATIEVQPGELIRTGPSRRTVTELYPRFKFAGLLRINGNDGSLNLSKGQNAGIGAVMVLSARVL